MVHFRCACWLRTLKWNIIAPVGMLVIALVAVFGFDLAHTGEAKPPPLLGELGTAVRGTITLPTATPKGLRPTAVPRATVPAGVGGTPAERDAARRSLLLVAIDGFQKLKQQDGSFPSTNGNIQTFCVFKDLDVGCKLGDVIGSVPADPLGEPLRNGPWYQSDGSYAKIYVSFEQDIPPEQVCETDNVDLSQKPNLVCTTVR